MRQVFALIAILLLGAAVFVLLTAARLPAEFRVVRSTNIKAPREKVFAMINDLRSFNQWNPFARQDDRTRIAYHEGPSSGNGAAFDWDGGRTGAGSLAVINSSPPASVTMRLDMRKPMAAHNTIVFELQSQGDFTHVSWSMSGAYRYVNRVFGVIFNMDKMIGGTFDRGLGDLKRLAETE